MTDVGLVIVGGSVAGVRTAQALRSKGYGRSITILDAEPVEPYDKPPLSKGVLTGELTAHDIRLLDDGEAERLELTVRLGSRAVAIDEAERVVRLENGDTVPYAQLVIATGARARRPDWSRIPGVFVVRSLSDVTNIRERLRTGPRLVIVGSGFIGAEAASGARALGADVTLVDPLPVPLARLVTEPVGELFRTMHEAHATTEFGVGVVNISTAPTGLQVELADGRFLDADTVVVGVGIELNIEWLAGSSVTVDNGVVCDEHGRALDRDGNVIDGLFAVGDVSRWLNPASGEHERVEHWTNAVDQAQVLAHNIAHPDDLIAHTPSHYVWSDQYDWKIQLIGNTQVLDVVVEHDGDRFAAFYAADDVLVGAVTVNWPRVQLLARRAITDGGLRSDLVATVRAMNPSHTKAAAGTGADDAP